MENREALKEIYKINSFKIINKTDFDKEKVGSSVYGELTQKGVDTILDKFKEYFNKNTIFYDLGCGLGKMVLQVGLQTDVRMSIGVEYSKERYEVAVELKKKYGQDNIEFLNLNLLDLDLSMATVVYIDNTIFPVELMKKVYNKIPKNCLLLYKQKLLFSTKNIKQNIENDLVERTYNQKQLCWLIK